MDKDKISDSRPTRVSRKNMFFYGKQMQKNWIETNAFFLKCAAEKSCRVQKSYW